MTVTWAQVKLWQSSGLHSYADEVFLRRDTVEHQTNNLSAKITSFQGSGQSADALRAAMGRAKCELTELARDLNKLGGFLKQAAHDVTQVEFVINQAEKVASDYGCEISSDGKAIWQSQTGAREENYRRGAEANVEKMVSRALELANATDDKLGRKLGSLGEAADGIPRRRERVRDLSQSEQERFKNMSPEERAEYWSQQSEEQKRHLCDKYPDMVGNADGVEGWARDRANRNRLPGLKQEAQDKIAYYAKRAETPRLDEDSRAYYLREKEKVEQELASYVAIEKQLGTGIALEDYQHGKQGEPISLLTLQNDGIRVKAAVAQGDVDHAKHVATQVPGVGTTVPDSLETYMQETANLRRAAADQGNIPVQDVATVAWLGYDAPSWDSSMTNSQLADTGANRLAGFLTGLRASREHGAGYAHMTVVAHSYGSTTAGIAATRIPPGTVDDMIMYGSPGMGTYDARKFNVDPGHLWVSGIPEGDSIQGVGVLGIPGVLGYLGKNPLDSDSGFKHLSGDATGAANYNHHPSWGWDASNHAVYLEEGTESLKDMARVVVGVK